MSFNKKEDQSNNKLNYNIQPEYTDYGMTQWHWLVRHKENFKLGKDVQIGNFTVIGCEEGVTIEDNVKVGYHCVIMSYSSIDNRMGKVVLKENCKIGANSVILPDITIGENSIVGANSLVTKSIPKNELWYGSPAKFIRKL